MYCCLGLLRWLHLAGAGKSEVATSPPGPRPRDLHPSVVCVVLPYSLLPGLCGGGSFRSFMVLEVSEHHVHCILLMEKSQSQPSSKRREKGHVCSGIRRIIGGHIWRLSPCLSLCPLCPLYLEGTLPVHISESLMRLFLYSTISILFLQRA